MVTKEEQIEKIEKKNSILTGFLIVGTVVILLLVLFLLSANSNVKNYRENYEWKCHEGSYRECIEEETERHFCGENEYGICIGEDETYTICDTDRKERAICIDEDEYWNPCDDDEYQLCVDKNVEYIECTKANEVAKCLKGNIYSYFTGRYIRECNIGEVAMCKVL